MKTSSFSDLLKQYQHIATWLSGSVMFWAMMWVQIHQHETGFQTNDSYFYFEVSDNILAGKAWVLSSIRNDFNQTFSPFPPLYPLVISILRLPGLSAFAASKVLNALLASGMLWVFCQRFKAFPILALWPFFTDHFMFVFCHSWSEPLFAALLLGFLLQVEKLHFEKPTYAFLALAFLIGLCFTRYIGAFAIFSGFLLAIFQLRQGNKSAAIQLIFIVGAAFSLLSAYLIFDYLQSGMWTGGSRYPHKESFNQLILHWLQAIVNELLIFRNLFPTYKSVSAWLGIVVQTVLMVFVYLKTRTSLKFSMNQFLFFGLVYLGSITFIRGYFYFAEPFDTRLLFPGAMLVYWGINEHFRLLFCRS